ncbi:MAG TPA: MFS transporter [Chitinophagaceae bacterium]|nr:MFS transporter [Chitinophagaceae bacterium]
MYKKKSVFFAACTGMLLFGISIITLGSVAAGLKEKFNLDDISSGTLFSILPIGVLAGSLIFGPFCDKYGYKLFLVLSSLCMFAGFQCIALASSINLLKVSIFIFGMGGGAINGAANAVVSDVSFENKRTNLSLLGVFFALGALGMPFILGLLENRFNFETIVSAVSSLTIIAAIFFLIIKFPPPKQKEGVPFSQGLNLLRDPVLILIAFFLFCQSSLEGIINNWTTNYLINQLRITESGALYALSLFVAGMAVMRILIGSVFRKMTSQNILILSFGLSIAGSLLIKFAGSYAAAVTGLILIGAGLAAGFPLMLGFVGNRYAQLSGTAFSIVLVIALIGNMLVNLLMGYIAEKWGIKHLTTLAFIEIFFLILLSMIILNKLKQT